MKPKNKIAGLVLAGLASFGLLAVPLAVAVDTGTISTVDPNATVQFKIIKYKGEVGDTSTPLKDIVFKIQKVNIQHKLTTNEGWREVAGLTADNACDSPRSCDDGFDVTTGTDGSVKVTNPQITVGVYKVTEQTKTGYTAAAPFLITLPYTEDGTWNYALTAKPKNQVLNPTKTVKDTGATDDITGTDIGDVITYTVNVPVPADPVGEFKIEDTFPAGLVPVPLADGVTVASVPANLLKSEDYQTSIEEQKISITINDKGQAKLKKARRDNPSLKLVLTLKGKVTTFPTTADHQFANQADVYYPNRTEPVKTSSDTNFDPTAGDGAPSPTLTKYVDVKITKQGETTDTTADLSHATFEIYVCTKNGETLQTKGVPLKAATTATGADQVTTFSTANPDTAAKTATVTAYNLQDPRFRNGGSLAQPVIYCVVETKAPDGFVRDPNPREVTFAKNATTGTVTVTNQKQTILSNLPLTGATGVYILLGVGSVMVVVGLLLFLKRRNRDEDE